MYCDVCPHAREAHAILAPCQICMNDRRRDCGKCPVLEEFRKVSHFCENCSAGQLRHELHYDGAKGGVATVVAAAGGIAADAQGRRADNYRRAGVTTLDPDTEDKLRVVLTAIFELEPLELLLVRHVFRILPLSTFRETLRDLRDRLSNRYDLRDKDDEGQTVTSFKATVSLWGSQVVAKVPALADVFKAVKSVTAGHVPKHER